MCIYKNRQNESDREIRELKEKCSSLQKQVDSLGDLKAKYEALMEFVAANVGSIPQSLEQTPASGIVSPPSDSSASQESHQPDSQETSPPTSQDRGWQKVKNGAKLHRKAPKLHGPITYNRFQSLELAMEDEFETRLVGDSMLKGQVEEFCGRSSNGRRKCYSYSGARLDDIIDKCDEVTNNADANTVFIIHAGTNDVKPTRSKELLEKFRQTIRKYKEKVSEKNLVISGILPKVNASDRFYTVAYSLNSNLKTLCEKENVHFVNYWNNFYNEFALYDEEDNLHLNPAGAARLGRLLSDSLSDIARKNTLTTPPSAPP
ncbi:MAG: SGNH/GDSL hydrolase family protein [Pleurocapsa sp. MO_226.B13]|nr:SGNH/GDSL hydrolase family protein [Pleurocapsa sp. MO_226.B13]